MYIGKLAELTGASRKAIRFYESLGLIPEPERKGKYRVYSDNYVVLISMIRRAQAVGFHLSELKELVAHKSRDNRFPIELANTLISKKRDTLHKEMSRIMSLDKQLIALSEELQQTFGQPENA